MFRYGNDAVAKMLNPGVPSDWAGVEASITESVRELGVPAPMVLDVTVLDGRPTIVFEIVEGPSMWQLMVEDRGATSTLMQDFVAIQRQIHAAGIPGRLPGFIERVCSKIAQVDVVDAVERRLATDMARTLPHGAALLHGDFHPGNIVMGAGGPVVIDWFDASIGHPAADIVRSSLLVGADVLTDRSHLPGATDDHLREIQAAYLADVDDVLTSVGDHLDDWRAVTALSRLAELTSDDAGALIASWEHHRDRSRCRSMRS